MLRTILIVLVLCGCWSTRSSPKPRSCGGGCTINGQCADIFSDCRVCFGGFCTSSLPAQPASDAGVAPVDTQTMKGSEQ